MTAEDPDVVRTLRVTGTGSAEADADRCILYVSLRATAATTGEALTALSEVAGRAVASLRQEGVAEGDVRTVDVTLGDRWDRSHDRVVGRSAAYRMRVLVPGLARAATVLSVLAGATGDALDVESLQLTGGDAETLAREARRLAVLDARAKAAELASAAQVTLGELLSIGEGIAEGERGPRPRRLAAASASAGAPIPPLPIEGGVLGVTSTVTLVYRIE